jgi:POT family proton-dependent oligopeptide transporter
MVLLAIGTGLLKPTITSSVGDLYAEEDPRRDAGFSIYYMGISVGAVAAPLVVGTLGQTYDYHLGFGVAAVGMAFGLIVYLRTQHNLSSASSRPKNPLDLREVSRSRLFAVGLGIACVVAVLVVAAVLGVLAIALPVAYSS